MSLSLPAGLSLSFEVPSCAYSPIEADTPVLGYALTLKCSARRAREERYEREQRLREQ